MTFLEQIGRFDAPGDETGDGASGLEEAENPERRSEEYRQFRARELGLSEGASWRQIFVFEDQQERATMAKALGWEEDPEWMAEAERVDLDPYPSWRNILEMVLDLNHPHIPASTEQMIERLREVREIIKKDAGVSP